MNARHRSNLTIEYYFYFPTHVRHSFEDTDDGHKNDFQQVSSKELLHLVCNIFHHFLSWSPGTGNMTFSFLLGSGDWHFAWGFHRLGSSDKWSFVIKTLRFDKEPFDNTVDFDKMGSMRNKNPILW